MTCLNNQIIEEIDGSYTINVMGGSIQMNAKELADELEKSPDLWFKDKIAGEWIIATLRKQEEENAEMQRLFDKAIDEWAKDK
jgi:mono/diheme cytochrome c family protein